MIQQQQPHALVVVFDNLLTATQVAIALHDAGFSATDMEVITYGVDQEMPGDNRQDALETTGSSMLSAALKWGGVGLGAGATAGVVALAITSSPILGMGMIVVGGLTGAVMGGVAGIEHAVLNDSVDLPTAAEYRQLVLDGFNLVVLRGGFDDWTRAREVISNVPHIKSGLHPIKGHDFHEHSANDARSGDDITGESLVPWPENR